jgi:hypothetical protein
LTSSDDRNLVVLALLADPTPMTRLVERLREQGIAVDVVRDLGAARTAFFGAGGHDCLVIGPDVRPKLAQQVAQSLRAVDPALPTATFGPRPALPQLPLRSAMLAGLHPSSRAGQGALLRFLSGLGRR